jgi:hypothetical protein
LFLDHHEEEEESTWYGARARAGKERNQEDILGGRGELVHAVAQQEEDESDPTIAEHQKIKHLLL